MEFGDVERSAAGTLAPFFGSVFADSEGADEGAVIASLVDELVTTTDAADLYLHEAVDGGVRQGAICWSRLRYSDDDRQVFLLSPVAVATSAQRRGVGQQLIRHGLDVLRGAGADLVVTYGDPNYYTRVGFVPVTIAEVPSPQALSMPQGWLAQPLTGALGAPLRGQARSVTAFEQPELW